VTLVATYSGPGECFYEVSERVRFVYLANLVGFAKRTPWGYLKRLLALRRLIRDCRADVVVSFLANVNIAAILATRGLGVPVVACERNDPVAQADLALSYRLFRRLLYPLAEMVTVQTEDAARRFREDMPRLSRLEVVSNPIPQGLSTSSKPRTPVGRKRIIAMGRLSTQKQFALLIETFAQLAPNFPDWDLWIVGEGPLRADLTRVASQLGIAQRVFLPGRTAQPWDELARSDLFVLSSAYEGFPNVLLEAMALGLPCVAFDCPSGPREMTRDGQDALLVPANDVFALREVLRRVMSNQALGDALGSRAMASVRDRYSLERILKSWDTLLAKVYRDVASGTLVQKD
jgi:GalNAc-alpha-(1->4)-GalNAc-alpha-(1->3)-diNAcBac-PP-undecaprenol alpha-1,4-N-acetyl-D-galactosaminyltransferase